MIPPAVTYLISEIGVMFVFGCGAMLLGFALVTLMVSSRGLMPNWLRRLTLVFGLCGIAGLAWATFFVLLLGTAVIGAWLIAAGRTQASHELAVEARTCTHRGASAGSRRPAVAPGRDAVALRRGWAGPARRLI